MDIPPRTWPREKGKVRLTIGVTSASRVSDWSFMVQHVSSVQESRESRPFLQFFFPKCGWIRKASSMVQKRENQESVSGAGLRFLMSAECDWIHITSSTIGIPI